MQAAAGADLLAVAVEVKFEQRGGRIGRSAAPARVGLGKGETQGAQVEGGHEGVEETHRVVRADVIFEALGPQVRLLSSPAGAEVHAPALTLAPVQPIKGRFCFSHRL